MIGYPVVAIRIKDGRVQKHEDTLLDMNSKEVSLDQMSHFMTLDECMCNDTGHHFKVL